MLFDLYEDEFGTLKREIDDTINTAIEAALRAGMRSAGVDIKVDITLRTSGEKELKPEYKYKTKIKIGESYENGKGTIIGAIGMKQDEDGYWHQKMLDQQLSMVE